MVRIHAHTIRPARPQRTALKRFTLPTPMIAPEMVWVVETGIPAVAEPKRQNAAAVYAQNPPTGLSLVIFMPMVLTMRHPPASVPKPIAACAESTTQNGM